MWKIYRPIFSQEDSYYLKELVGYSLSILTQCIYRQYVFEYDLIYNLMVLSVIFRSRLSSATEFQSFPGNNNFFFFFSSPTSNGDRLAGRDQPLVVHCPRILTFDKPLGKSNAEYKYIDAIECRISVDPKTVFWGWSTRLIPPWGRNQIWSGRF